MSQDVSATASYTEILAKDLGKSVAVQAHPDNSDRVFVQIKGTSGDHAILEASKSINFGYYEVRNGLEAKVASGTQTLQLIY